MYPILFRTEFGFVYTFTAVWLLGLVLSVLSIWWQDKRFKLWDHLICATCGALVLGRAQFVLQNGEWFVENPAERWNLFQGGQAYAGVILGALLGFWFWTRVQGTNLRPMFALLAPSIGLLHFIGWLACWFDGCGYGDQTFLAWYAAELPNNFGLMAVRYQTQLAGMCLALLLLFILIAIRWQKIGRLPMFRPSDFWWSLAFMSVCRGIIYYWQGDDVPMWGNLRIDMLLAFWFAIMSLIIFGIEKREE